MKRTLPFFVGLLLLATPAALQAQFDYTTNADNTLTITGYSGPGGAVTIPTNIDGLSVTIVGSNAFRGLSSLTSVTISDGVASIGEYAFDDCTNLTSATIPGSVTNMGLWSFQLCGLISVSIADGVTGIGDGAFEGCSSLTSLTIPGSVTSIGGFAFSSCGLTNMTIPSTVTSLGQGAFDSCTDLASVVIGTNIANIEDETFYSCSKLISFTIPASVTNIGSEAFFGCASLTNVTIPDSISSIANETFAGCTALPSITIPVNVTNIGSEAFFDCAGLTNVTIPDSITSLANETFARCTALPNVTIPASVTNIGSEAFFDCASLTNITIEDGVTSIGSNAFAFCGGLTNITIPGSVSNIGIAVFEDCSALTAITVSPQNSFYSSVDGVLFNKSQTTLIEYPDGLGGSYVIASNVTTIANSAFAGAVLTSVTIPGTVTSLGGGAFDGCSDLTNVYFNGNAPTNGATLFVYDVNATIYYLPGTSGWSSTFGGLPAVMLNPPVPFGDMKVTLTPAGAVAAGAQWQVDGGIPQPSGATVLGLSVSNHTVSFNTISNWTTPSNQTVSVSANSTSTATGAYGVEPAPTTNSALGATALLVGPLAGTNSVVLAVEPQNGLWMAGTNATWLHLSPANQSGIGSTNVVFSYDANPGGTRSGTLTISGQTLTVTQAGATYVAARPLTTLVSSGLNQPQGVALDGAGNVYIADTSNNMIKEWTVTNNSVSTLVASSDLNKPIALALNALGDIYIANFNNNTIDVWTAANSNLSTFASTSPYTAFGVAVDGAGNVYFSFQSPGPPHFPSALQEWTASNGQVIPLPLVYGGPGPGPGFISPSTLTVDAAGNVYFVNSGTPEIYELRLGSSNVTALVGSGSGLILPWGIAVDGSGNLYIAGNGNNAINELTAVNDSLTTLVSSGLYWPLGVAVDGAGNVYIADSYDNAIKELPYAFVDSTAKLEGMVAGNDALPGVLPATENLLPPFAPTSDQSWLTMTGITNGVVSFSFTANSGPARTANITLLGQTIPITQGVIGTPPPLSHVQMLANGAFQFSFTNNPSAAFTVVCTTDLSLPLSNWTPVGPPSNTAPGVFQFTSQPTTNGPQLFYAVRSP